MELYHSYILHPTIIYPSKITKNTAKIIENILTNVTDGKITGGLIMKDVSDHLLFFFL